MQLNDAYKTNPFVSFGSPAAERVLNPFNAFGPAKHARNLMDGFSQPIAVAVARQASDGRNEARNFTPTPSSPSFH